MARNPDPIREWARTRLLSGMTMKRMGQDTNNGKAYKDVALPSVAFPFGFMKEHQNPML